MSRIVMVDEDGGMRDVTPDTPAPPQLLVVDPDSQWARNAASEIMDKATEYRGQWSIDSLASIIARHAPNIILCEAAYLVANRYAAQRDKLAEALREIEYAGNGSVNVYRAAVMQIVRFALADLEKGGK